MKFASIILATGAMACVASAAQAATATAHIVYINGIQTTATKLQESRAAIRDRLRDSNNRTGPAKRDFIVEAVFNPMGWYHNPQDQSGCNTLCQDNYEMLALKAAEEDFAASFQKILAPYNESNVIDVAAATEVKRYADSLVVGQNSAISGGFVTIETMADTKTALDQLLGYMRQYPQLIVVAHSEGNLLADLSWAALVAELKQDARKRVRFINVANTARFSVSGLNLTHDSDVALAALTILPGLMNPKFRRETPDCHIDQVCNLQLAGPTFKRPDDFSCGLIPSLNPCTHYFKETYLSGDLIPLSLETNPPTNQGVSYTPSKTAFADRFEDLVYAAALSLEIENWQPITVLNTFGDGQFCSITAFGGGGTTGTEFICSGLTFGLLQIKDVNLKLATSFQVPTGTTWNLSRIELPIYLWTGTNNLIVQIRQDEGGLPGPALFTKTFDNAMASVGSFFIGQTSFPTITVDLSSAQLNLTSGRYWTEVSSAFLNTVAVWSSRSSDISTVVYTSLDGSTSSFASNSPSMIIQATTVP